MSKYSVNSYGNAGKGMNKIFNKRRGCRWNSYCTNRNLDVPYNIYRGRNDSCNNNKEKATFLFQSYFNTIQWKLHLTHDINRVAFKHLTVYSSFVSFIVPTTTYVDILSHNTFFLVTFLLYFNRVCLSDSHTRRRSYTHNSCFCVTFLSRDLHDLAKTKNPQYWFELQ